MSQLKELSGAVFFVGEVHNLILIPKVQYRLLKYCYLHYMGFVTSSPPPQNIKSTFLASRFEPNRVESFFIQISPVFPEGARINSRRRLIWRFFKIFGVGAAEFLLVAAAEIDFACLREPRVAMDAKATHSLAPRLQKLLCFTAAPSPLATYTGGRGKRDSDRGGGRRATFSPLDFLCARSSLKCYSRIALMWIGRAAAPFASLLNS